GVTIVDHLHGFAKIISRVRGMLVAQVRVADLRDGDLGGGCTEAENDKTEADEQLSHALVEAESPTQVVRCYFALVAQAPGFGLLETGCPHPCRVLLRQS